MWELSIPMTYQNYRQTILKTLVGIVANHLKDINTSRDKSNYELDETRGQSSSTRWHTERTLRITASRCKTANSFGEKINNKLENQINESMLNYIRNNMWSNKKLNPTNDMKYGIAEEANARFAYCEVSGNKISETGMWIDTRYPFLGASPDGLILNNTGEPVGVLEIKCLKLLKDISVSDLIEQIEEGKIMKAVWSRQCFEVKNRELLLKENHAYFYQIQLQMLVTGLSQCL